jgi:hypothetical protein
MIGMMKKAVSVSQNDICAIISIIQLIFEFIQKNYPNKWIRTAIYRSNVPYPKRIVEVMKAIYNSYSVIGKSVVVGYYQEPSFY